MLRVRLRTWALRRLCLWMQPRVLMMLGKPWCPQPQCFLSLSFLFQMPLRPAQRVECSEALQGRSRTSICSGNWRACEREWGDSWLLFVVVKDGFVGCDAGWLACDGSAKAWRSWFPSVGVWWRRVVVGRAPSTPRELCGRRRLWAAWGPDSS
jgi:hypothetical protein